LKFTITGQNGFIGSHLKNSLVFLHESFHVIDFDRSFFHDPSKIDSVFSETDVIIHTAGINRSKNENDIFEKNISLTKKIIESLTRVNFKGKLIFTSSTQESLNNNYGKVKKESSKLFFQASKKNGFSFMSLIIPNVFGPFCKPNYNSFISTFSYNLINNYKNNIQSNSEVSLIYIDNLINLIIKKSQLKLSNKFTVVPDKIIDIVSVNNILKKFHNTYVKNGAVPEIKSDFELNLFNTFRSFLYDSNFFPKKYLKYTDERGDFTELVRANTNGQFSYSSTNKGHVRGNHFHTKKIERFSVIYGKALVELRRVGTKEILNFKLDGENPSYIDIPIWYTHNIKNIGEDILYTNFWISESYDPEDADTFFEEV